MQTSSREIKALTGLRAIAAFWVLLFHLKSGLIATFPEHALPLTLLTGAGFLGVDLFFVLSGFIISYTYAERFRSFDFAAYCNFLWARLARIYPVHLFTLMVFVAFIAVVRTFTDLPAYAVERYTLGRFLENLMLVHAWDFPLGKSWNSPAWSISAEWLAYLLFPLVTAAVAKVRRPLFVLTVMIVLFGLLAVAYSTTGHPGTASYGLVRLAIEFPAGCLLYQLYRRSFWSRTLWGCTVIALTLLAVTLLALDKHGDLNGMGHELAILVLAPMVFAAVIYALAWEESAPISRWLGRPSMLFWGRASYSLYMVHFVLIAIFTRFLPWTEFAALDFSARLASLLVLIVAILIASAATYRLVEVPSRRWMRRRLSESEPVPALGRG